MADQIHIAYADHIARRSIKHIQHFIKQISKDITNEEEFMRELKIKFLNRGLDTPLLFDSWKILHLFEILPEDVFE